MGPVLAYSAGRRVDLGPAKQRCVLAVLLLEAGHVVPLEQLLYRVWGENPPRTARSTLYSYVTRIRGVLREFTGTSEDADVVRHAGGYVLDVPRDRVDIHRFRRLTEAARTADNDLAGGLLRAALELWKDEALSGLSGEWADGTRVRLEAERVAAALSYNDLRLRQGMHTELVPELRGLTALHPLDERLAEQLMTALYRSGHQAEALEAYEEIRRRLTTELAIDPHRGLRALHHQIMAAAPAPEGGTGRRTNPAATVPRQLPARPGRFVGRVQALSALDGMLSEASRSGDGMTILTVQGMGGIGKTWLSLRWAHQNLERFPDGQLYVDLRGFDCTQPPATPATAIRGFLEALGVAPEAIPESVESQAGLYRSLTADLKMLVLLDNAQDSEQVASLLPGSSACTTLITSRNALTGLRTTSQVRPLVLEALGDAEARGLLAGRLGRERVERESEAVGTLVDRCVGLPLALGILATRAASYPDFPLALLAEELRNEATRLDAWDTGELSADLRAVFRSSCSALDPETRGTFTYLGLLPGPEFRLHAVARLVGLPVPRTRAMLHRLATAHLLQQPAPDCYRMHDLVRLFAIERSRSELTGRDRTAALERFADFCIHAAHRADRLLTPRRQPIEIPLPEVPIDTGHLQDEASALAWFTAEHTTLMEVQELAVGRGWHERTWQLAWVAETYRLRLGHSQENLSAWKAALDAVGQVSDPALHAHTRRYAGRAFGLAGEYADAVIQLSEAKTYLEKEGDLSGLALTHHALGWAHARLEEYQRALVEARRSLRLFLSVGNPDWVPRGLNAVGWYLAKCGNYRRARVRCNQALELFREHDPGNGQAAALDSLGFIEFSTGEVRRAVERYREAHSFYQESGDRYEEANTLTRLGEAYRALGERDRAEASWTEALSIYETQHRFADACAVRNIMSGGSAGTP